MLSADALISLEVSVSGRRTGMILFWLGRVTIPR